MLADLYFPGVTSHRNCLDAQRHASAKYPESLAYEIQVLTEHSAVLEERRNRVERKMTANHRNVVFTKKCYIFRSNLGFNLVAVFICEYLPVRERNRDQFDVGKRSEERRV